MRTRQVHQVLTNTKHISYTIPEEDESILITHLQDLNSRDLVIIDGVVRHPGGFDPQLIGKWLTKLRKPKSQHD